MSEVHNPKSKNWCLKSTTKSDVRSLTKVWQNPNLKSVTFCLSLKPKSSYNAQNSKSEVESLKSKVESLSEVRSKSEFRNPPISEVLCPK